MMNTSFNSSVAITEAGLVQRNLKDKSLFKYRLMILWRFILAIFGGYAIAMFSAILIAQIFGDYRASAAMSATLIAFTLHTAAFIWVFMINNTVKASLGIIVPTIVLFVLSKLVGH